MPKSHQGIREDKIPFMFPDEHHVDSIPLVTKPLFSQII